MKKILSLLFVCLLAGITIEANAQLTLKDKVKRTGSGVDQRVNVGIERGLDAATRGIGNALKKKDKAKQDSINNAQAQQQNQQASQAPQQEPAQAEVQQAPPPQEQTQLQSYSKYDFIPGEKVIFFDDFSQDAVGDFPVQWNTNGSAEVVTTNLFPGHWMSFACDEAIWTDALLDLPDNYTIEFDIIPTAGNDSNNGMNGYHMRLMKCNNVKAWDAGTAPGKGGFQFTVEYYGTPRYNTWFYGEECGQAAISGYKDGEDMKQKLNQKYHIAIWVQKTRIRLYLNQTKLFDLPKALPTGCIKIDRMRFESGAAMVSNVRIAVGAPDMRSKLITEGKLISYGIYFDVNKDVVKPESYGTLKEIAAVLNENPDVRVKIVGHTDSDGADAANLDLSKRRGESVKNELVKTFGIDASRLESDGAGETQPVAPNDTPANKALNRRVEFIKL